MTLFRALSRLAGRILADRRGATVVEYGLIISLIILVMLVSLSNVAGVTIEMWGNVSTRVVNAR